MVWAALALWFAAVVSTSTKAVEPGVAGETLSVPELRIEHAG